MSSGSFACASSIEIMVMGLLLFAVPYVA
jgi:hypothetical protein